MKHSVPETFDTEYLVQGLLYKLLLVNYKEINEQNRKKGPSISQRFYSLEYGIKHAKLVTELVLDYLNKVFSKFFLELICISKIYEEKFT